MPQFCLLQHPEYVAKLKCHLTDKGDPYYYLHPVKVEVAHLKPEILVHHDVISEKEMGIIKDLGGPLVMS